MNNSKVKNNVFLVLLSVLLLVGSIFAFTTIKNKNNIVYADSVSTSFNGSSVYVPFSPQYYGYNYNWEYLNTPFSSSFPSNYNGSNIWTDGLNYYFSYTSYQYILDISNFTWSTMTWTGLTSLTGSYIWTDGVNYYYSNNSNQYVLDVSTHTWSTMTWTGLTNYYGSNIWTDGLNYYYSYNSNQYVLDVSTHTWSTMTWTGYTVFYGSNIWTDGVNYYLSSGGGIQYILDVSTHTWSTMTWTGLTSLTGSNIWTDGVNYYYSNNSNQYVLDVSTHTWSTMTWNGLNGFSLYGSSIVQINDYSYCLYNCYAFIRYLGALENRFDYSVFDSVAFTFTDLGNSFALTQHSVFYYPYDNSMNFVLSDKITQQLFSTDFISYVSFNYNESLLQHLYIPYYFNGTYYYASFNVFSLNGISKLNFNRVTFSNSRIFLTDLNKCQIKNTIKYFNSIDESITITFDYFVDYDATVYLFDNTSTTFYDVFKDNYNFYLNSGYYLGFNERTYYFVGTDIDDANYQQGYSAGYNAGQTVGYNSGYSAGSDAVSQSQYNAGYSAGYAAGSIAGNNYTFLGLISAVIDAPIKAFTGLFNFELLGVNLMNFITALFTLAVIITIVKKVV